ncbi:FCD domain-containing protein [uncultured Microbacterium sp.]|uniref:FadR/GntR family transcriptional regulator n=1 Tax=uncultured Microbacterium sp. TaxID=191216 RepID=UPI00262B097A|nr:FCD domain-containing protein [uncultured Microbacterium sp.]
MILGQSKALLVAEELERSIQTMDPQTRIGTRESLQKQYGVARATINEAVKILHDRGRIIAKSGPGGGLFTALPDAGVQLGRFLVAVGQGEVTDVADAIELRDHLEHLIVRQATQHRCSEDLVALHAIQRRIDQAAGDHGELLTHVWALHQRIAEIAPNAMLRATYLGAVEYVRSHIDAPIAPPMDAAQKGEFFEQRVSMHRRLVDVIESGDADAVDAVVAEHNRT